MQHRRPRYQKAIHYDSLFWPGFGFAFLRFWHKCCLCINARAGAEQGSASASVSDNDSDSVIDSVSGSVSV